MKNKKNIMLMMAGLLGMTLGEISLHSTRTKAEGGLAIFENGAFSKEVTAHNAGSSIDATEKVWQNDGNWNASRVYLAEGFDLTTYSTLKVTYTYTVTGEKTWVTFGMGNASAYGDYHYYENGVSFVADGAEHEIELNLSDYLDENLVGKCVWQDASHTAIKVDASNINAFSINTGNGILKIKKMEAFGSTTITEDKVLLKDGVWASARQEETAMASISYMEDNQWKIRGNGDTLCRVRFTDTLNLSGYKRLIVEYKNSNSESIRFGIGETASDYGYVSAHNNYKVEMSGEVKTVSINLVDYEGAAFDKHQWGTASGNLNLAKIQGFDILTNANQNIDIVSIVASPTEEEKPFDPTPVDGAFFDNTNVNETAVAIAGNSHAYIIGYGTGSVYVGTADEANNLNTNIAKRVEDGGNYAIQYTNANLIRYDMKSPLNLFDAMLNNGWLEFDLKFDTLPSNNKFNFRLYDGSGLWNERFLVEKEMDVVGAVNEWHTYRFAINQLDKICKASSWGEKQSTEWRYIDMSNIQGVGFLFGEDVTVTARNLHYGYEPIERSITGIEATTSKTSYNHGEKLDPFTFTTNVLFDDGNKALNVSNFTVTLADTITPENKTVNVSFKYNGTKYNTTVELSVNSAARLVIKTLPEKLIYNEGEKLDLTGIEVEAVMQDESTLPLSISDLKASVDYVTEVDTVITISYAGASASFDITVNSTGKKYSAFDDSYLTYNEETQKVEAKRGFFLAGNDDNSETPTAYFDKVEDNKLVMVSNQTSEWRITRFLCSDGVLNLNDIVQEDEIFILITYRTSNVAKGKFNLFNPVDGSDWDQGYVGKEVDFNNDGTWHTLRLSFDDFEGAELDGYLSGEDTKAKTLSARNISGFGIGAVGKIEIASVNFKWAVDMNEKWLDTKAPEITYDGEVTFNQKAGEKPHEVTATAYDSHDGEITPTYTWSDGALDANGNLKEGTHTLTITARDAAGNESTRVITYIVAAGDDNPTPPTPPTPTPEKKGLPTGAIVGIVLGVIAVLGAAGYGIYLMMKKKSISYSNENKPEEKDEEVTEDASIENEADTPKENKDE